MAGTKYAYVRNFELPDATIPDVFLLVRIDGKGFHKFSAAHDFAKPNDPAALELMNEAARHVMSELKGQASLAFGESDEYSFLLKRSTTLYNRRVSKITTHITSLFTSAYLFHWPRFFPNKPMLYPPSFDGRLVIYPNEKVVRDYFAWRQADTHINNLYNTTFWALVHGGQTEQEATKTLTGTVSAQKHDILFKTYGINYDKLEAMYRKGTTIVWTRTALGNGAPTRPQAPPQADLPPETLAKIERKREQKAVKRANSAVKTTLRTLHCDIISDDFWLPADAVPTDDSYEGPAWLDPSRLHTAGLGAFALLD